MFSPENAGPLVLGTHTRRTVATVEKPADDNMAVVKQRAVVQNKNKGVVPQQSNLMQTVTQFLQPNNRGQQMTLMKNTAVFQPVRARDVSFFLLGCVVMSLMMNHMHADNVCTCACLVQQVPAELTNVTTNTAPKTPNTWMGVWPSPASARVTLDANVASDAESSQSQHIPTTTLKSENKTTESWFQWYFRIVFREDISVTNWPIKVMFVYIVLWAPMWLYAYVETIKNLGMLVVNTIVFIYTFLATPLTRAFQAAKETWKKKNQ